MSRVLQLQVVTALSLTISTIVLAITGIFGGVGEGRGTASPPKDEETLKQ